MRLPDFLKENGTIGFAAPSFGCNIEPYRSGFINAQKKFRDKGFSLDIGPNCYEGSGIGISNTPKLCGEELNSLMTKESIDAVISCGGGELMCEVLDFVDFERIAESSPKWFMGFSDNTNMTFLLPTLCDTAAIYAPCAPAFGMEPWHEAVLDAWDLLTGKKKSVCGYPLWEKESLKDDEHPLEPYNVTEPKVLKSFVNGKITYEKIKFSGRLLGGCLDCLSNLVGTKYDRVAEFDDRYKDDGIIWFMEACELNVMGIRRAVWQLSHAGWFSHVKGFLIGRPLCFGEEFLGLDQYHAVIDVLADFNVPIIMDVDLGHLPPMMPMIVGAETSVCVNGNDIVVKYF